MCVCENTRTYYKIFQNVGSSDQKINNIKKYGHICGIYLSLKHAFNFGISHGESPYLNVQIALSDNIHLGSIGTSLPVSFTT